MELAEFAQDSEALRSSYTLGGHKGALAALGGSAGLRFAPFIWAHARPQRGSERTQPGTSRTLGPVGVKKSFHKFFKLV